MPESTSISLLLDEQGKRENLYLVNIKKIYISILSEPYDTCTYNNIIDDNEVESIAKIINYYYSIKYEFDHLLMDNFKINNNANLIQELEHGLINSQDKKRSSS